MSDSTKRLFISLLLCLVVSPLISSCAYLSSKRKTVNDGVTEQQKRYKALEEKYNELLSKSTPNIPVSTAPKVEGINKNFQQILSGKKQRSLDGSQYDRKKIARELRSLNRLVLKINKKKYGDAVLLAKELEKSRVEQIRAQARFLLAQVMEQQGESLLAAQIYEEIAVTMRFSIFSKKSIDKGIELAGAINDSSMKDRFRHMKAQSKNSIRRTN